MSKYRLVILLGIFCTVLLFGCNRENENNQINEGNPAQDERDGTKEEPSNNGDNVGQEDRAYIEGENVVVSNQNARTFTSTISVIEDRAVQSYELDQQIQNELVGGGYTLEDPFVILNPFGISPLTALVLFETEEEVEVRVTVKGESANTDVVGNVEASQLHRVPIIGLYPGKENEVIIELLTEDGTVTFEKQLSIATDPLPSSMDNIVKVEQHTEESAYGLTLISGFGTIHPLAFDQDGNVRWYLTEEYASYGYFPLANHHFIVMDKDVMVPTYEKPHAQQMYEMDYLGRIHQIYMIKNGAHHEVIEKTPNGNLLVLSNSIDDHVEDVVYEFDRQTGEIVNELDMREIFGDTHRDMIDWAHLNTASYVEEDNTVVLSPRNVHSGIKVEWSTKELKWILGHPQFWEGTDYEDKVLQPVGDIIWHFQPHTIYQLPMDLDDDPDTIHVMLFDNHWHGTRKVDFYDQLESSYVTIYNINEDDMTVSQFRMYEGIKSKVTSNSLLEYDEGRVFFMGGYLAEKTEDGRNGMIYEYDYETAEALNQYSTRYTFYRGYGFQPDYNTVAIPMELQNNYFKGTLTAAVLYDQLEDAPEQTLEEDIKFLISQQILYIEAFDNQISYIEFIGDNHGYILDLSRTGGGDKKYEALRYQVPVPFSNLEPDEYQIVLTIDGARYNTNETITIQ